MLKNLLLHTLLTMLGPTKALTREVGSSRWLYVLVTFDWDNFLCRSTSLCQLILKRGLVAVEDWGRHKLHCKYIQRNDSGLMLFPGLQFFHVSHIREITLIRCHSAVIPLYVFAVWCAFSFPNS